MKVEGLKNVISMAQCHVNFFYDIIVCAAKIPQWICFRIDVK
jgi:hypothetical protein